MLVHELKEKFSKHKNYATEDLNELLDFVKKAYVYNEISTSEYKKLVRELESRGATMPTDKHQENSLIENPQL